MSERERRIGLNEAVFREVNERIEQVADAFDLGGQPLDLVCECADASCVQRISLPRQEYESLRSEPRFFVVYPGHVDESVERIVDEKRSYVVVEKREGEPAQVAELADPRSD
jgi:hypothetical protein